MQETGEFRNWLDESQVTQIYFALWSFPVSQKVSNVGIFTA